MLFDRQLLYLVFLFGVQDSTSAAIHPRLESAEISSQSSSSASSAGLVAVSHATKIYPSQDATSVSSSTTRRSAKSTNRDSSTHQSTSVQSASNTASPSGGPNNPASTLSLSVTKSGSTTVKSRSASHRSAHSSVLSFARSSTKTIITTRRPGASNTTHPHTKRPEDSTVRPSQHTNVISASSRVVSVLTNGNTILASAKSTHNQSPNITTSTSATSTSDPLHGLISALGHLASLSGSNLSSTMSPSPTTTNALSILFSALPSSVADPIESDFDSLTSQLLASSTPTHHRSSHHSTHHTSHPTTITSSTSSTSQTSTTPTTIMTPISTPSTHTSTPTANSQTSPTISAASSSSSAPAMGSQPISNASVAGIATGVSAGAVLVLLGTVFLLRRRKQGKAPFGASSGSQRSKGSGRRVFPEVAWLYDPPITPPRSPSHGRTPSGSGQSLIPDPRPGSVEMEAGSASPNLQPARASSPLLAPTFPGSREQSPGGSPDGSSGGSSRRSRGASTDNVRRPLTAIFEEQRVR